MQPTQGNAIAQECLEACYQSLRPRDCLANYVAKLRSDPGWRENEVEEFERTATRMLSELLDV
jgi:hypothetical protein